LKRKVFCIGFHKTGTTTMRDALAILGYRVTGPDGIHDPDIARNLDSLVEMLARKHDAFQDNPWPLVYRKMDGLYPGSRFILTVRDPDAWLESAVRHFGDFKTPMRELIYGVASPRGHEAVYRERMVRHNEEVLDYFKDRPGDLLVLDVAREGNWQKLCGFLGEPVPAARFPHANTAGDRRRRKRLRHWGFLGRAAARIPTFVGH
jgi:hypothetical protein